MTIFTLKDLKKGKKYIVNYQKLKERFGRSVIRDYGVLKYKEPYSENSGTGDFETENGEIITLKARDVLVH